MKKALVLLPLALGIAVACGPAATDDSRSGIKFTNTDGGPHADAGHQTPADGGHQEADDAGTTPTNLSCGEIVQCGNGCGSDQSCQQGCYDSGSTTGQNQFQALLSCIGEACPSTTGGPCATQGSSACTQCLNTAQDTGGACASTLDTCFGSTPTPDAGPSTGTGCAGIITCENDNNCSTSACIQTCFNAADANGKSLYTTVNDCLLQNCSSSAGGPCANQSSQTCATCIQNVQATGGACRSALTACQADM